MNERDIISELRRIRQHSRISQDAVGAAIGKHRRTVVAYELGEKPYSPDVNTVSAWADTLGYELTIQPKKQR
jgi:transcriptional regulator with XRE-family HTH domain